MTHPTPTHPTPTGPSRPDDRQAQARWDAAVDLIRAADDLRLLAQLGRATDSDKRRHDSALVVWQGARTQGAGGAS